MATLTELREAFCNVVNNALGEDSDFFTYPQMVDMPTTPCLIVEPADADFCTVMQRGQDDWYFMVYVLCSRTDTESAQKELDEYIAGSGPKSIRHIIYDHPDLDLGDNTQAFVMGMKGYGGAFEANRTPMVGAVLTVKVSTDGR